MQLTKLIFITITSLCYILLEPKVYGQNKIKILDFQTNVPIPYASVFNKKKQFGFYVNEYGELLVPNQISANDTLIVSSVGYETQRIIAGEFKSEIYLKSKTHILNEVKITPRGGEISLGSKKESTHFVVSINKPTLRNEIALLIKNDHRYRGKIMSISFYFSPQGKPKTPFKIRLYSIEEDFPKEDLLRKDLVALGNNKGGWTEIDLKGHNIRVDENGIFVSMESLYGLKKSSFYTVKNMSTGRTETNYGQSLGLTDEFETAIAYQRQFNGNWTSYNAKFPSHLSKATFYPMMKIKIKLDE